MVGERTPELGREYSGPRRPVAQLVVPADLSGPIADRAQPAFAPQVVVRAGPSVLAMLRFEEVDAVTVMRADDQQSGLRVEARRPVVGGAALVWRNQHTITRWFLRRIGNWTS